VAVGIVLLLVSPLWILEIVTNSKLKLGVIVGFLLTLLLFLTYAIVVTPFEVFAATAGYVWCHNTMLTGVVATPRFW